MSKQFNKENNYKKWRFKINFIFSFLKIALTVLALAGFIYVIIAALDGIGGRL